MRCAVRHAAPDSSRPDGVPPARPFSGRAAGMGIRTTPPHEEKGPGSARQVLFTQGKAHMSAIPEVTPAPYREVTDVNGRVYRVGETDRSILGRPRAWMVWLPWFAMMGVSVFEYGYSSAESTLESAHGWTLTEAFWIA